MDKLKMIELFNWYLVNSIDHINYISFKLDRNMNKIYNCIIHDIDGNEDRHTTLEFESIPEGFVLVHGNPVYANDGRFEVINSRPHTNYLLNKNNILSIKIGETFELTTVNIMFKSGIKLELWGNINDYYKYVGSDKILQI